MWAPQSSSYADDVCPPYVNPLLAFLTGPTAPTEILPPIPAIPFDYCLGASLSNTILLVNQEKFACRLPTSSSMAHPIPGAAISCIVVEAG